MNCLSMMYSLIMSVRLSIFIYVSPNMLIILIHTNSPIQNYTTNICSLIHIPIDIWYTRYLLLVQPLCLYWVTCLRIRAFAMAVYMRRRSIIIRAFDGNARLLAKITAVCIDIYIFLWGNLSRAIIYFSNSIKERFTNSTREFCNSLFADVRFGLTIRNKLVYV